MSHPILVRRGIIAAYLYDAWGLIADTNQTAMAFADWGYTWDGKPGRYYVEQRHLRADLGRWMSVDPVETEPPYTYVGNRPTWAVDPSGEQGGTGDWLAAATWPTASANDTHRLGPADSRSVTVAEVMEYYRKFVQPGRRPFDKLYELHTNKPSSWDQRLAGYEGTGPTIMKILAALLRSSGAFRKQFMSAHLKYEALQQGLMPVAASSSGPPTQGLAKVTEEWRPVPGYEAGLRASSGEAMIVPPMERRLVVEGKPLTDWEVASLPSLGQWILSDTDVGRGLVAMSNDATSPGWAFVGTLAVNLVAQLNEVSLAAALLLPGVGALGTTGRALVVGAIAGLAGKQVADGIFEVRGGNVGSGSADIFLAILAICGGASIARGIRLRAGSGATAGIAEVEMELQGRGTFTFSFAEMGFRSRWGELVSLDEAARTMFGSLDYAWERLGMPNEGEHTLARLGVGRLVTLGRNSGAAQGGARAEITLKPLNIITPTHAEAEAFQRYLLRGGKGKVGVLFVTRELCRSCGRSGGVGSLMRAVGLERLLAITKCSDGSLRVCIIDATGRSAVPVPTTVR